MQPQSSRYRTDDLTDRRTLEQRPEQYEWSSFDHIPASDQALYCERIEAAVLQPPTDSRKSPPAMDSAIVIRNGGFALPNDKTITISVIAGPSKGVMHRLVKPIASVGRAGGGADVEIDDPNVSALHCALGVRHDVIRLRDLDSTSGLFINDERVLGAELEHLSEFRVGSSLLLVAILPKGETATT